MIQEKKNHRKDNKPNLLTYPIDKENPSFPLSFVCVTDLSGGHLPIRICGPNTTRVAESFMNTVTMTCNSSETNIDRFEIILIKGEFHIPASKMSQCLSKGFVAKAKPKQPTPQFHATASKPFLTRTKLILTAALSLVIDPNLRLTFPKSCAAST